MSVRSAPTAAIRAGASASNGPPFALFDPILHPSDLSAIGKLDLAIGLCWVPITVTSAWLARRGARIEVGDSANVRTLPATFVRVCALGAPLTFALGFGVGARLVWRG